MSKPKSDFDRFMSKVEKTEGCWLWRGGRRNKSYGSFSLKNGRGDWVNMLAHRAAWHLFRGFPGYGLGPQPCVLHHCDNPMCVNPDHLFLGSRQDNNSDMVAKKRNRWVSGERQGLSKLKREDIPQMIRLHRGGMSYQNIGKLYGVSNNAAWKAVVGKTWEGIDRG